MKLAPTHSQPTRCSRSLCLAWIALGSICTLHLSATEIGVTETVISNRLTLQPAGLHGGASLRLRGPAGYLLEREFSSSEPISVDLLAEASFDGERGPESRDPGVELRPESAALQDGVYRWELLLFDSEGSVQRTDGVFLAERGFAISLDEGLPPRSGPSTSDPAQSPAASGSNGLRTKALPSLLEVDSITVLDGADDGNTYLLLNNDVVTPSSVSFTNQLGDFLLGAGGNTLLFGDASSQQLGVGTTTPAGSVHITDSADPEIVLEDTGGPQFELESDNNSFQIRDDSDAAMLVIEDGGNPNQLVLDASGRVGIGTAAPGGNLHIWGTSGQDIFSAIGPLASTDAFNFGYSGATFGQASGFFNVRPAAGAVAPNPALYFATGNVERLMIDNEGYLAVDMDGSLGNSFNPVHPIHAQSSGARLTAGGVWTNASSRTLKENIGPLAAAEALKALAALVPVRYNYKAVPEDPQLGFIAEDVPEIVATPDRKGMAAIEVVALLTKVVQEQQKTLEAMRRDLSEQERTIGSLNDRLAAGQSP